MKRIRLRTIIILLAVALILFFPIPSAAMSDGGSMEFSAMTYKIVKWHRLTSDENGDIYVYSKTSVYWFPHNFKDIDELWELEEAES